MRAQHDGDGVADDDARRFLAPELRIEPVAERLLEVLSFRQIRHEKVEEDLLVHGGVAGCGLKLEGAYLEFPFLFTRTPVLEFCKMRHFFSA